MAAPSTRNIIPLLPSGADFAVGAVTFGARGDLLLGADLRGHGDIAFTSSADLTVTSAIVSLDGSGALVLAGTANALLAAALAAHGDLALDGRADLLALMDMRGTGAVAFATGTPDLQNPALSGHGDIAFTGTGNALLAADLSAHGDLVLGGGTNELRALMKLDGHADIAYATAALEALLAADLRGHSDLAFTGTADLTDECPPFNPSVELGSSSPLFWTATGAQATWSTAEAHTGTHSLRLTTSGFAQWQSDPFAVTANQQYNASGWVKGTGGTVGEFVVAFLFYTDAAGTVSAGGEYDLFADGTFTNWTQLSGGLTTPASAVTGRVIYLTVGAGDLFADDFSLCAANIVTIAGHGDLSLASRADLLLLADLQAHGDVAFAGRGDLLNLLNLQGHGDLALLGTSDLLLLADLVGHGDIALATGPANLAVTTGTTTTVTAVFHLLRVGKRKGVTWKHGIQRVHLDPGQEPL